MNRITYSYFMRDATKQCDVLDNSLIEANMAKINLKHKNSGNGEPIIFYRHTKNLAPIIDAQDRSTL